MKWIICNTSLTVIKCIFKVKKNNAIIYIGTI